MPSRTAKEKQEFVDIILGGKLNALLNLQLAETIPETDPSAHTKLILQEHHLTPHAVFHGGLLVACLDTTALLSCLNSLEIGEHPSTVSSAVQFHAGVIGVGKEVHFHTRLVKRSKRLAFCEGEVLCGGVTLARASFVKAIAQPKPASKL